MSKSFSIIYTILRCRINEVSIKKRNLFSPFMNKYRTYTPRTHTVQWSCSLTLKVICQERYSTRDLSSQFARLYKHGALWEAVLSQRRSFAGDLRPIGLSPWFISQSATGKNKNKTQLWRETHLLHTHRHPRRDLALLRARSTN